MVENEATYTQNIRSDAVLETDEPVASLSSVRSASFSSVADNRWRRLRIRLAAPDPGRRR